ncbi:hypothetical protein HPB52_017735 [Rhipicephalus sanguineus]|uniref:Uncharacterized protein n=1 Tax=Rhipicephalus sanguineus TaxID=34632 RepID=A0A9D4T448_RHISA|nr:hypothetical protein HPB52_017735 [Rhipicephalus sanguineus]
MTRRTQVAYEALFEEVLNFAADTGLALNPKTVSTDFELAAINAIRTLLPSSDVLVDGFPRGNNAVQALHQRSEILVGAQHVNVFPLITTMKREQARVEDDMEGAIRGQPRRLRSKK